MRTRIPPAALLLASLCLVVANGFVLAEAFRTDTASLTVSFLDVGQGDAILIETPSGVSMLIDAGKDRAAVRMIPRVLGPLERDIDIVLATHPDADHIGGIPDVLGRYVVETVLVSGRGAESSQVDRFAASLAQEHGVRTIAARQGMRLHLGDQVYADVLYPEENVASLRETNDASVIVRLVYEDTAFMLTGDAPMWVEDRLVAKYGTTLKSDILKAGHHGSKTSTGDLLLAAVDPETVVVSAGKDNSYGHPHEEVLTNIEESGASVVSTAERGTITFVSDGARVWQR